jgi:hypothetical protein
MTKHLKTRTPSDVDLKGNPMIGGSKGVTMAGVTPDDLEASEGVNTIEGDVANDTNAQGGVDKAVERGRISRGPPEQRDQRSRRPLLQGRKTHEQQLRTLERQPDVPDGRQTEAATNRAGRDEAAHVPKRAARESEFPVSRGGLHQESRDHNKHNRSGQAGHKPQQHGPAEQKS